MLKALLFLASALLLTGAGHPALYRDSSGRIVSTSQAEKKPYGFYSLWAIGRLPDGKYTINAEFTLKNGRKELKSTPSKRILTMPSPTTDPMLQVRT